MRLLEEYKSIENDFFEIDHENKIAKVEIDYDKPSDIYDKNCLTKTPLFSDDFDEWVKTVFDLVPNKYKIDLTVRFSDMENETEESLKRSFEKNIMLQFKSVREEKRSRDFLAYGLLVFGAVFFVAMMLVGRLWAEESIGHDIFFYIFDIFTTVLFWEAAGILLVQNREWNKRMRDYGTRFTSVRFLPKNAK